MQCKTSPVMRAGKERQRHRNVAAWRGCGVCDEPGGNRQGDAVSAAPSLKGEYGCHIRQA
jgi:hypothetical protein